MMCAARVHNYRQQTIRQLMSEFYLFSAKCALPTPTLSETKVCLPPHARLKYMLKHELNLSSRTSWPTAAGQAGCLSPAALRRRPSRSASSLPWVPGMLTQWPCAGDAATYCQQCIFAWHLPPPPPPAGGGANTQRLPRGHGLRAVFRAPGGRRSHLEEAVLPAGKQYFFPCAGLYVAPTVRILSRRGLWTPCPNMIDGSSFCASCWRSGCAFWSS